MTDFAKDPSFIYQKAYYDKLYNQISLRIDNGVVISIPVYDSVPADAVAPYIILSTTNFTPIGNSDSYIYNGEITLDIVTRFAKAGDGGKKMCHDISNQIFQKVLGRGAFYQDAEWNIFTSALSRSTILETQNVSDYVIRKLVTFSNKVQQL